MDLLPGEAVLATFKQDNLRFVLSDTLAPLEASLSVSSLTKHSRHAKRTQSSHHQHQHPQRHYDNCSGSIRHHQVGYNRHQHQELQQHHQHHSLLSNPIASFLATANPFSKNSQAEPPVMPLHHHAQNDTSQNMAASKISYPPRQNLHQSYQQSTAQGHSELHLTPPPPIPPPPPPPSTHRLTTAEHQGLLGETVSSRESNQMTKSPRGAAKTQIILTNYRICLVAKDEHMVRVAKSRRGTTATTTTTNTMPVNQTEINGPIVIIVQVILGSISSINLDEDHRLALRLKFDSLEYTIFVQDPVPPGPPVTTEIFSCLTRILFQGMGQSGVQGRFPFIMGPAILRKGLESADTTDDVTSNRVANLWTAEDIYSIPTETPMASNTKALGKNNKATSLHTALGWSGGYDIEHEYKRLQFRKDQWSIEDINMEFELSPTYPKQFIMPTAFLTTTPPLQTENSRPLHSRTMSPASSPPHLNPVNRYSLKSKMPGDWRHHSGQPPSSSIESETGNGTDSPELRLVRLQKLARFRSNARFPMLCWKTPRSGLVLMRCSQPLVGILGARGPEDELYVRSILETAAFERSETATNPKLCIMDARAYSSAVANGYIGGGRENAYNYPNATISFMSLGNIHAIASSHSSLLKAVSAQAESPNWHALIESTGWLTHVADLLKAAGGREGIVGKMLQDDQSVLVHCTDGHDRTSQLVSLAQILLDPYFRTIQGLRVLIEKEWLQAGHPFQSRTDSSFGHTKPFLASTSPVDDESWRYPTIHSSPNGAKESLFFSSASPKWRKTNNSPRQETKLNAESIPPFAYHMNPPSSPLVQAVVEPKSGDTTPKSHRMQQFRYPPPPPPQLPSDPPSPDSESPTSVPTVESSIDSFTTISYPSQTPLKTTTTTMMPAPLGSKQSTAASAPSPVASSSSSPFPPAKSPIIPIAPSPVFILFLTCLHHIVQQNQSHFEYNDYLLVTLARAAQGGISPFGDFLFNSEKERNDSGLRERTASIWPWVQRNVGWFTYRDYVPPLRSSLIPRQVSNRPNYDDDTFVAKEEVVGGSTVEDEEDEEAWREDVLSVQSGGRYMSIWAELYFDATPAWFPDSRRVFTDTVDSIAQGPPRPPPSFKAATATAAQRSSSRMTEEERSKDMTMTSFFRGQGSQRKNLYRAKDPWYASQFDQGYIQQLVFPGFVSPAPTQQQQHQLLNHRSTDSGSSAMSRPPRSLRQVSSNLSEARVVIPPALALLKGGPEMHAYYALVQHLRTKRRQQVQTAFMAWHIWATKRSEARQAQDAGWGIVDFSEEELEQEQKQKQEQEDDDERSNRRHHDRRRQPRLVVVAAKKGVDIEMDRVILAKEPFFGHGPIEYEDETEEEEEEEDEEDQGLEITGVTQTKLGPSESRIESDEVDGFDDFGFPVDVSSL